MKAKINYIESIVLDFYNVYQDIMKYKGDHLNYIPELYEEHITNQSKAKCRTVYIFSYEEFEDLIKRVNIKTMKYEHR